MDVPIGIRIFHLLSHVWVIGTLLLKETPLSTALHQIPRVHALLYVFIYMILVGMNIVLFYMLAFSDPGFLQVGGDYSDQVARVEMTPYLTRIYGNEVRRCYTCKIVQPVRTVHCERCQRCVRWHDHHCDILNKCVGEKNHMLFLLFVTMSSVMITWSMVISYQAIVFYQRWGVWILNNSWMFMDIIILLPLDILTVFLTFSHTYLWATGTTLWEHQEMERISKLDQERCKEKLLST